MDPSAVDPFAEQMPIYDEDSDENFTGPAGIASLFNEEYDEDDEEYYDDDGSYQQEPLETSASQRVDPDETTQAETVSGHTQIRGWLRSGRATLSEITWPFGACSRSEAGMRPV